MFMWVCVGARQTLKNGDGQKGVMNVVITFLRCLCTQARIVCNQAPVSTSCNWLMYDQSSLLNFARRFE